MNHAELAQLIGTSKSVVNRLMNLPAEAIVEDREYIQLLQEVDADLLKNTLQDARDAYNKTEYILAEGLEKHGVVAEPMTAYLLGNWVAGAMQYPETGIQYILDRHKDVLRRHENMSNYVFQDLFGGLMEMVEDLPTDVRAEWRKALALFTLPLMCLEVA